MANKKSKSEQAKINRAIKHELARLKKLGLYKGDARKKPTRYAKEQVKKYADVLKGRAKVITVPKRSVAREYLEVYRTKFRKVVIPVRPGEKLYYNKTKGVIFSYNKEYGHTIRRIFPKHPLTEKEAAILSRGGNIRYAIPIGTGDGMRRMRFLDFAELKAYMSSDSLKGYNNWQRYVEVEEILARAEWSVREIGDKWFVFRDETRVAGPYDSEERAMRALEMLREDDDDDDFE